MLHIDAAQSCVTWANTRLYKLSPGSLAWSFNLEVGVASRFVQSTPLEANGRQILVALMPKNSMTLEFGLVLCLGQVLWLRTHCVIYCMQMLLVLRTRAKSKGWSTEYMLVQNLEDPRKHGNAVWPKFYWISTELKGSASWGKFKLMSMSLWLSMSQSLVLWPCELWHLCNRYKYIRS